MNCNTLVTYLIVAQVIIRGRKRFKAGVNWLGIFSIFFINILSTYGE
ncbi:protein of unknown function [Petrocella atlantisensis]|uniref:Uncharacterized protein n=1 Tax=Petrocella atlantisensis TaxID=2173034 RepID=A0A3P7S3M4_9FIRM|nr:protein of unknown function [Petrocella atlantisensis]